MLIQLSQTVFLAYKLASIVQTDILRNLPKLEGHYTDMLTCLSGFMYGNIYDEEERFERQAVFPKLLAKHAEDFSWVSHAI